VNTNACAVEHVGHDLGCMIKESVQAGGRSEDPKIELCAHPLLVEVVRCDVDCSDEGSEFARVFDDVRVDVDAAVLT
jgi:hypothetical protein